MRYLEAKALTPPKKKGEHKMQPGIRADQQPEKRVHRPEVARMAEELGVDIERIKGTGAEGTVTKKDVRLAREQMDKDEDRLSNES